MEPDLTDLGNLMIEHHWVLEYGLASGCRCGSCYNFKFVDMENMTVHEEDSLEGLVRLAVSATREET